MWSSQRYLYLPKSTPSYTLRSTTFISKDFQIRYTILVLGAAFLGILVSAIPIYHLLHENYHIFVNLAYDHSPNLLDHLEREKKMVSTLLLVSCSSLLVFFGVLSFRLSSRIAGPLRVLENHLRETSRGKWFLGPISTRQNDEFKNLIESYNYFYNAFRAQQLKELELLKQLKIETADIEAYTAWEQLINEKCQQLGIKPQAYAAKPIILSDAIVSESPSSRHAS